MSNTVTGLPGFTALVSLNKKTEMYLSASNYSSISILPQMIGDPPLGNDPEPEGTVCAHGCGDDCRECKADCKADYRNCKTNAHGDRDAIADCKSEANDCYYMCCFGVKP